MPFLALGAISAEEITVILLGLGVLLIAARIMGEIAQRYGQPAVLGELLVGVILGPSLLGTIFPNFFEWLFPEEGNPAIFLEGFTVLAIALYLFVAGIEVNLSTVWEQGRAALIVGFAGILVPFAIGFGAAWVAPYRLGMDLGSDNRFIFALFMATALSISALPVIAKTLMDLNIYRSDFGMIIISAAIFNDIIGWIIFAMILGMIGDQAQNEGMGIGMIIVLTLAFSAAMLTVVRWAIHKFLPWLQAHTTWPGGTLSAVLGLALLGAAFTEWIGIHAIFGAFLVGIAIGDSAHLRERTRSILEQFISFIFAPIFFASVGLRINLLEHFDLLLCLVVLLIACVGKVVGCGLGARLAGMDWPHSLGIGFGMNARGTMEIILGLLALQFGVINEELFVALVVMALVTSMMSGPAIQRILRRRRPHRVADYLVGKTFIADMKAGDRRSAIAELSAILAKHLGKEIHEVEGPVWEREQVIPTGLGSELAVPHARLPGLAKPALAIGISQRGIDFDAPDGNPARLIFLLLTPAKDSGAQLDLLADIGRTFKEDKLRANLIGTNSVNEFLALMKTGAD